MKRSIPTRALPFALCALTAAFAQTRVQTPAQPHPDPARAEQAYLAGARLVDRQDFPAAQAEFTRAVALDPARQDYALALDFARQAHVSTLVQQAARARIQNQPTRAEALLAEARRIDPQNDLVTQHTPDPPTPRSRFEPVATPDSTFAPPLQIQPAPGPKDLHLRGETREVVTQVAAAYGIKTVFDDSVSGTPPLRFDLDASPYTEAMPILLRMAHLFAVTLDAKTLFLAKDTQENRARLERQIEETIFVPGSNQEQLNELSNIVKNVFDVKQVAVQLGTSSLVVRAPEPTLKAVNYTLADLIDGGAEVVMELKLYSVDKMHTRNTGLNTPTSIGVFSVAQEAQNLVNANQTLLNIAIQQGGLKIPADLSGISLIIYEAAALIISGQVQDANLLNLLTFFGHGLTLFGITTSNYPTLNLALNTSESRALDDITVRTGDRQLFTLRVGSKYPITTSTYSSGLSGAASSALAGININGQSAQKLLNQYLGAGSTATIPQVQYEDLGLTLKTTPSVLKSGLISMHVELKIEALTGASANNIPVLTSRAFTSDVTVPEGQTALMLSELSSVESAAVSGIPGLASLPGFQESLADKVAERDSSELVLMITPHLVRRRANTIAGPRIAFQTSVPTDY